MQRHTAIARGTMTDYVTWGPTGCCTWSQRYAIVEISEDPPVQGEKMSKGRALKIKLRDPQPSLTNIGRFNGALPTPGVHVAQGPRGSSVHVNSGEKIRR